MEVNIHKYNKNLPTFVFRINFGNCSPQYEAEKLHSLYIFYEEYFDGSANFIICSAKEGETNVACINPVVLKDDINIKILKDAIEYQKHLFGEIKNNIGTSIEETDGTWLQKMIRNLRLNNIFNK
jgi:hypothetical protein